MRGGELPIPFHERLCWAQNMRQSCAQVQRVRGAGSQPMLNHLRLLSRGENDSQAAFLRVCRRNLAERRGATHWRSLLAIAATSFGKLLLSRFLPRFAFTIWRMSRSREPANSCRYPNPSRGKACTTTLSE